MYPFNGLQNWFTALIGYDRAAAQTQPDQKIPDGPTVKGEDQTESQAAIGMGGGIGGGIGPFLPAPDFNLGDHCQSILDNPDLSLVRGTLFASMLSGSWSVECDDDAPDGAKELIEKYWIAKRGMILKHALSALDYGYAPFEVVWDTVDGNSVPIRFKPLAALLTTIWNYPSGDVAGLQNRSANIWGADCLLWSYNADPAMPYGKSRLRSVHKDVWRQEQVKRRIDQLANRACGVVLKVTFPEGSGRDRNGVTVDNRQLAKAFGEKITEEYSGCVVSPNAVGLLDANQRKQATVAEIIKLLETDLWKAGAMELGEQGPAITALQAYSAYLGVQITRGYHQPERSLQEGTAGTKAEAGTHTDTGTADAEQIESEFVDALNEQSVNDFLVVNYGESARGTVRVVAHPLKDVQEQIDAALIQSFATNATTAGEIYRTRDIDAVFDRRGIPKRETPLPDTVAQPPAPPTAPEKPEPDAPGKPGDKAQALMSMLSGAFEGGDVIDNEP